MDAPSNKILDPLFLGMGMCVSVFLGMFGGGKTWIGLVCALTGNLIAFMLGIAMFRRTWPRDCWNATRAWAGIWLIACGVAGIFLTLVTAFANFGEPGREGYAMIIVTIYGNHLFWFFGGIILIILGIVLLGRCLYLRPLQRR